MRISKRELKNIIKFFKLGFLLNLVTRSRFRKKFTKLVKAVDHHFSESYVVHYNSAFRNELTNLFSKYGSDKGPSEKNISYDWMPHTYSDYYYHVFCANRNNIKNVLEVGIGSNNLSMPSNMGKSGSPGASLKSWRDFFPNAFIYGCDIDPDTLFTEERIFTFQMDQTDSKSIIHTLDKIKEVNFDIVIDDGLHTFLAGKTLFSNVFHRLSADSVYVIEDVHLEDLDSYCEFFNNYPVYFYFVKLKRTNEPINSDNNLLVVKKC